MGAANLICNQAEIGIDPQQIMIVRLPPYSPTPSIDIEESIKTALLRMNVGAIDPILIPLIVGDQEQTLSITLINTHKRYFEHSGHENQQQIFCLQSNNYSDEIKDGSALQIAFILKQRLHLSVMVFIGMYGQNKREKGCYLMVNERQAIVFKGYFGDVSRTGTMTIIKQKQYTQYWGGLDKNFKQAGNGKMWTYYEDLEETHYYQGCFQNGCKSGKGTLHMKKQVLDISNEVYHEEGQIKRKVKQIQQMLRRNRRRQDDICTQLINFFPILATQRLRRLSNILNQDEFDMILEGEWRNDTIYGLVEQRWPHKNYRFKGIYKDNARNGYGEEYIYDQIMSKGFYSNGDLIIEGKNGEDKPLGFKLIDGEWKR